MASDIVTVVWVTALNWAVGLFGWLKVHWFEALVLLFMFRVSERMKMRTSCAGWQTARLGSPTRIE
jgi:hypothetical protein